MTAEIKVVRVPLVSAAKALSVSVKKLKRIALIEKEFTILRDETETGNGKIFLLPEEVEIYGRQGLKALREHRAKQTSAVYVEVTP